MSARSDLQQNVAAELEAMGLKADTALGRVQGKSGYSRDVYFEDVRVGFAGRLRIFSGTFVTVSFGPDDSERYDSVEEAVTEVASRYQDERQASDGGGQASYAPQAALSPSPGFAAPRQGRPSQEDIEAVRAFLLTTARIYVVENKLDVARGFAEAATRLGAAASEIVEVMFGSTPPAAT